MNLFLNEIQVLNYKKKWLKIVESDNLVNYFFNVDKEVRGYLEYYYMFFKNYDCEFLDSDDIIILSYIEIKIDDLLEESKDRILSPDEIYFLSRLFGGMILYNKEVSDDKIACYVNNCYLNNKDAGLSSDLLILLKYTFNYLNNYNNADINFKLRPDELLRNDFGEFRLNYDTMRKDMFIGNGYYIDFMYGCDDISLDVFSYMVVLQTAVLLHEFRHYMQFRLIFRDAVDFFEDRIKKEIVILQNNKEFYDRYYESFKVEVDAYKYAVDNLDYMIKSLILDDYYDRAKNEVVSTWCYEYISDCDIEEMVEEEYKKCIKKR